MPQQEFHTTAAARDLIAELQSENGNLVFHLSGGCCDGSQPMCFPEGEFRMGASDVEVGEFAGVKLWMSRDTFTYWQFFHLTLDVVDGRGSSFSLEIPKGKRFLVHSKAMEKAGK